MSGVQRLGRAIVVGLLGLGLAGGPAGAQAPAPAQPAPAVPAPSVAAPIAAPSGWTFDAQLSGRLTVAKRPGMTAATTQAYRPPASGAVLYVTRLELKAAPERRDAVASAEIHELQGALRRQGANAKAEASAQRADTAAKQLEASLTWRDTSAGVVDRSRTLVAADAGRVVAVTGQCVLSADAAPDLAKACEAALATLDPGIAAGARVPLSLVTDTGAEPAVAEPAVAAAGSGSSGTAEPGPSSEPSAPSESSRPSAPSAPSMSAPRGDEPALRDHRIAVAPQPAHKTESDKRPVLVGLGLIVLAALFWWNRRRRERFEAEDGRPVRRPRRHRGAGPAQDTDDADDADDLHAAAKGGQDSEKEKDA